VPDLSITLRPATACLGLAFASGLVLAGIRFASDRASPRWLAALHGLAAASALALLLAGLLSAAQRPSGVAWATALLLAAAAGGLTLSLGYRRRQRPLPEGLVFAHMSVAFIGALMVGMAALTLSS
jgi:peptidoglycan/LPS O-acetylase OafA/YrhL